MSQAISDGVAQNTETDHNTGMCSPYGTPSSPPGANEDIQDSQYHTSGVDVMEQGTSVDSRREFDTQQCPDWKQVGQGTQTGINWKEYWRK